MEPESLAKLLVDLVKVVIWPALIAVIIIRYRNWLDRFLETFKEWTKLKFGSLEMARDGTSPPPREPAPPPLPPVPPPTGVRGEGEEIKLSYDARSVISALWKHQQEYFGSDHQKGRWTFAVFPTSIYYRQYMRGLIETMKLGLVAISEENQGALTNAGIEYCQSHPSELYPDWDYHRWTTTTKK